MKIFTRCFLAAVALTLQAASAQPSRRISPHPQLYQTPPETPYAAPAKAIPDPQAPWDIAGLWQLTITPDPSDPDAPPPFQALLTATVDHNWITTETDEQVTTQGRWSRSSNDVYNLTGWQYEFVNGQFNGTFKFRAQVQIAPHGKSLQGKFQVDFYDPSGTYQGSGVGTLTGTPLEVEPL